MITISDVVLGPDVEESVLEVIRSGRLTQGPRVEQLEAAFADLCGVPHAVAVNSGTTALIATLQALGIGPGDEVIVPAFTFAATANAVLHVGATARVVDVRPDDFALDADGVAAAITPRTAAVVAVHLFGQTADLGALERLTSSRGLHLVEDAAQAHGATDRGRIAGSVGTGCFSFYATKNLVAGEGGMITTRDARLAEHLRILRNQGMRRRYEYEMCGQNYRMTDLAAAVVLPQLARYGDQVERRRVNAEHLTASLGEIDGLVLPTELPGRRHVWHQYTVRVAGTPGRDALAEQLAARGIATGIYYPRPIHGHECYRRHPRVVAGTTPVADLVAQTCLSLPVHAGLDTSAMDVVADAVKDSMVLTA
jgi:perosamine synthetase